MSIFTELINEVSCGKTFHIDFVERTMKVGNQKIINKGEWDKEKSLIEWCFAPGDDVLNTIERLYISYKNSLPSERSENKRKKYFKALTIEELDDEYIFATMRREVAQAQLEGFILCMILNGSFVWDEEKMGKWFWESKNDSDLIILRSWIDGRQKM